MDCYQPEQTPTAAKHRNEDHTPNIAAASGPDLANSPEHSDTEDAVKTETDDIHQVNDNHTASSQNPKSNAPSPEAAPVINTPKPLDHKPPSKDVNTEMKITDLVNQVSTAASQSDKHESNPTAISSLETRNPGHSEAAMKNEIKAKSPDQSKRPVIWKSPTHSRFFHQHNENPPSEAIAEPKTNKDLPTTAPSAPQPAVPNDIELAARARKANAESKSPFSSPRVSVHTHY